MLDNGRIVARMKDDIIQVFSISKNSYQCELEIKDTTCNSVNLGKMIAIGNKFVCEDYHNDKVFIYDPQSQNPQKPYRSVNIVITGLCYCRAKNYLLLLTNKGLVVYDISNDKIIAKFEEFPKQTEQIEYAPFME